MIFPPLNLSRVEAYVPVDFRNVSPVSVCFPNISSRYTNKTSPFTQTVNRNSDGMGLEVEK